MDESVSGEEVLFLPGRPESLHLASAPSGLPMRVLWPIVHVSGLSMVDLGESPASKLQKTWSTEKREDAMDANPPYVSLPTRRSINHPLRFTNYLCFMSTFRIPPADIGFEVAETHGDTETLVMIPFEAKAEARQWVLCRVDDLARMEQAQLAEEMVRASQCPARPAFARGLAS